MASVEGGSSSSSCGTARHSLVRFQKRKHVITLCSFSSFQPRLIRQTYTERRRLAPECIYGIKHAHTHQQLTQLTIVKNIIERKFVAAAILSYNLVLLGYTHPQQKNSSTEDSCVPSLAAFGPCRRRAAQTVVQYNNDVLIFYPGVQGKILLRTNIQTCRPVHDDALQNLQAASAAQHHSFFKHQLLMQILARRCSTDGRTTAWHDGVPGCHPSSPYLHIFGPIS